MLPFLNNHFLDKMLSALKQTVFPRASTVASTGASTVAALPDADSVELGTTVAVYLDKHLKPDAAAKYDSYVTEIRWNCLFLTLATLYEFFFQNKNHLAENFKNKGSTIHHYSNPSHTSTKRQRASRYFYCTWTRLCPTAMITTKNYGLVLRHFTANGW